MAFLIGSFEPSVQRLAVPAVCLLIAFLAYTSQWLFANAPDLAPGPLTTAESYTFNGLILCIWYTYYKACTTDPGRYVFPSGATKKPKTGKPVVDSDAEEVDEAEDIRFQGQKRWCKKCAAPKPPRAHHCRTCRRCVPKMDHHCPWTSNCVSLQTFPHFLRFLAYTNVSLWTLLSFLSQRFLALWHARHLPAYLGPTLSQLALLTILSFVAGVTSLALGILLATTVKGWLFNTTMIESWEIERHEAALERQYASSPSSSSFDFNDDNDENSASWWASNERAPGGDVSAPHLALGPVEFPYDIGIFANMAAAMGTGNPVLWFFPLSGAPRVAKYPCSSSPAPDDDQTGGSGSSSSRGAKDATGWAYEENDLNDRQGLWPPADPDKIRNAKVWRQRKMEADRALERDRYYGGDGDGALGPEERREAFRARQMRDLRRWEAGSRSRILGELEEVGGEYEFVDVYDGGSGHGGGSPGFRSSRPTAVGGGGGGGGGGGIVVDEGKSGWVNAEGEHLGDYGVDEEAEFDEPPVLEYDEERHLAEGIIRDVQEDEDVPLAELIRRRKVRTKDGEDT
ncbi:hypothetical protein M426DRAFT_322232 [Hypoxylon sp. CI-4A]|nr:hypothetical protein M426DRAFT_322232 [Hypoxylon sp. CI-4A]